MIRDFLSQTQGITTVMNNFSILTRYCRSNHKGGISLVCPNFVYHSVSFSITFICHNGICKLASNKMISLKNPQSSTFYKVIKDVGVKNELMANKIMASDVVKEDGS